jgi:hypothetical protein
LRSLYQRRFPLRLVSCFNIPEIGRNAREGMANQHELMVAAVGIKNRNGFDDVEK